MLDACWCQQGVQERVPLLVALLVARANEQRDAAQQNVGGQAVVPVARPAGHAAQQLHAAHTKGQRD